MINTVIFAGFGMRHHNYLLYLLSYRGAHITVTDTESYTPLMLAAREGHLDAFNTLLKRGSPIHKSVLHIAAEENHVKILEVSSTFLIT